MADGVDEKTYSAKQVATRIGTDAKQLRKFFRDPKSGYTPVGQGGRYDFPEGEIPKIKAAFDAWNATKVRRNRSPQRKLAEGAGLIPRPRKETPGTETPPRPRRRSPEQLLKEGLHGNALDEDDFKERTTGIGARVKKHGLIPNQQGRLVPKPEHIRKAEEVRKELADKPIEYPDLSTIPGLDKPAAQWLDFRDQAEIDEEERMKREALDEFFSISAHEAEIDFDDEEVEDL